MPVACRQLRPMGTVCPSTRNAKSMFLALHGGKPHTKWVSPALLLNTTDRRDRALALRRNGTAWLVSMDLFSPKQSSLVQTAYLGKSKVCANLLRVPRHCVGDGKWLWAKTLPGSVLGINQYGQLWIRLKPSPWPWFIFLCSLLEPGWLLQTPDLFALCRCELMLSRALQ